MTMARAPTTASAQQQDRVDRITRELQADSTAAPKLLLERAQAYGDMGEELLARSDLAQAAALVKESRYKTPESVAAVEQAFRELTVAREGGGTAAQRASSTESEQSQYRQNSNEELAGLASEAATQQAWGDVATITAEIGRRVAAKQMEPDSDLLCALLDVFHSACEQGELGAHDAAKAVAASAGAAATKLAASDAQQQTEANTTEPQRAHASTAALEAAVARAIGAWDDHDDNSEFRQKAARYGARMYAACAYALATHLGDNSSSGKQGDSAAAAAAAKQREMYKLYIGRVWLEATAATATAEEAGDATQGLLRMLTADRTLFAELFAAAGGGVTEAKGMRPLERLLAQLGQSDTAGGSARGMAMLVVSQLVAAAKGTASGKRSEGPPAAIQQLRADTARILDGWIQSTKQAERTRGLQALAALYESGTGTELAAELWLQRGWAEELWDQGEWDGHDAQLALLHLADASSAHATVAAQMKRLGSALVLKLARRKPDNGADAAEDAVANAAAGVLAKWAGLPADAAAAAGQEGVAPEAAEPTPEADPVELADQHMSRITAQATAGADAAATMEASVEALGYLSLRPSLKEHIVQNSAALAAIFACGQASGSASFCFAAAMLVRNLTQPRAVLSEEQQRLQQLQRMGNRAQSTATSRTTAEQEKEDERELDAPPLVARRAERVCAAGAVPMLVSAVLPPAHPSDGLKDAVAEIFAALATAPALRGRLVQQGAVSCLLRLLTPDAPKAAAVSAEPRPAPRPLSQPRDRNIAWALAKIGISVPPHLAFRHPREIVRLLLALAAEDADTQALLMRFEALLALTNLASAPPGSLDDVRAYLAIDLAGFGLIESALLSSHPLVRRAATELACNLVYDPAVFERFAAGADKCVPPDDDQPEQLLPSGIVELPDDDDTQQLRPSDGDDAYRAQRLHLLVALSDVDDVATRSASAGALAILSSDPRCARYLFLAHPRASAVFADLATDDCDGDMSARDGMRHRVAVICANAAACTDTRVAARIRRSPDLVTSLRDMAKDAGSSCAAPASRAVEIIDGC
ncbi:SWI5-dependent HO expression protein 4 [Coemansia guatemalensis]|uniref:SWI5-dependent HO expression protein 4 n=1 Tax=Coemansia guatemalensis TaxID=2761395 RepID=A0A9W8I1N1_9FUNG|nr:SWI5-dependent HO expression protein 4 [Coemansia guatemalensis]